MSTAAGPGAAPASVDNAGGFAAPEHGADESLSHRRLGVGSLVFMIIAASAPLTVLAGGVPTSFGVAGVLGVPMGYVAP